MSEQKNPEFARREFLGQGAKLAVVGVTLASGVTLYTAAQAGQARPVDEAASSAKRWGMIVDTTKCVEGCNDCVTACNTWNGLNSSTPPRPTTDAQWIRKVELRNKSTGTTHSLPVMCQHCENPPCTDVCPTGASFKRADGIVMVDRHICIGCRYCMMACPYKARSFVHEVHDDQVSHNPRGKGCVESCNLCVTRVDAGGVPACVEGCSHQAIVFGDLNDPAFAEKLKQDPTSQIREDLGLNPGIHYKGI